MREVLEGYEGGIQIGVRRVTNLRYADDIILLVCSEIQLQELVNRPERVSRKFGLLINEKTKVMTTGGSSCSITINNMLVEVVSSFPYLGSLITDDACLLYTSPSPRDGLLSRMPSSA